MHRLKIVFEKFTILWFNFYFVVLNGSCYIHTHVYTRVIKNFKTVYMYSSASFLATWGKTNSEFALSFIHFSQFLVDFVVKRGTCEICKWLPKLSSKFALYYKWNWVQAKLLSIVFAKNVVQICQFCLSSRFFTWMTIIVIPLWPQQVV